MTEIYHVGIKCEVREDIELPMTLSDNYCSAVKLHDLYSYSVERTVVSRQHSEPEPGTRSKTYLMQPFHSTM